ncbi:multidrug efflux pump [Sphingobium faniae]|nr:multidrug efflux pump [Sphingobium faniae]
MSRADGKSRGNPFIERPLLACVLSAFILLAGLLALRTLPIALYPDILPPMVEISGNYPGATPEVAAQTVAAPLEQQINGAEGMIYLRSVAAPSGQVQIVASFAVGSDPDKAVIDIQNRVQAALPTLPEEVRRQGLVVRKLNWTAVAYVTIDAPDGRFDDKFISNYALVNVVDELRRIPGVSPVDAFGAKEHSIRIWLRPDRLAQAGLTPGDVAAAVREQNSQYATGRIGDEPMPGPTEQAINITTQGRFEDPRQFEQIILKTSADGRIIRLSDVARVELGARDYSVTSTQGGRPALTLGIFPQPGANAVDISNAVHQTLERLGEDFPAGLRWQVPFDTTDFVRVAIKEVLKTLAEAILLVFLVVYLFLGNWRATLIPCLAVPISLTGGFAGMWLLGASINLATLFAMVVSIGIVVDDAIVVLENVERHMRQDGVNAREATRRTMEEVSGPLVIIVLVLTAIFLPIAFMGGLIGEIYRQFAITISVSVMTSGVVALTLTPALCALLLKPVEHQPKGLLRRLNNRFEWLTERYAAGCAFLLKRVGLALCLIAIMVGATLMLNRTIATSLMPDEDQGYVVALPFLPPAASQQRTDAVMGAIEDRFAKHPAVRETVSFGGMDPYTFIARPGAGYSFITLKPWNERKGAALASPALVDEVNTLNGDIDDAMIFGAPPPPIEGLSSTGGFEAFVQARQNADYKALEAATARLVAAAAQRPELSGVFTSFNAQVPQIRIDVDRDRAKMLGVPLDDIFLSLQSTFGTYYINDFNREGRVYRVHMQADGAYRARPEDLRHVFLRSSSGAQIPITALATVSTVTGPDLVERFNVFPAARVLGGPAPGYSSGQALAVMEELALEHLGEGFTLAWNSQAFLEKQSAGGGAWVYLFGAIMVFLILVGHYERISLPFAILLTIPFSIFGALLAVWMRGLQNDLYLQIGLITLIGLAAKNAILIVEFAARDVKLHGDAREAALTALRLRFRPIVMTSLAFILGVLPLAISSGAGANARHSIATGVIGGMLAATFLAPLFTPLLFTIVHNSRAWLGARMQRLRARSDARKA